MQERIHLSAPYVTEKDIACVSAAMRNGWIAPIGPELDRFESELSRMFQLKEVLGLNSGTSALHLAVKLAGIQSGDRVIIGSFTFIAAANAVLYEGGVPVFIDSDSDSWNVDPVLLEEYFSGWSKKDTLPKAIIVTHIFGRPAKMQELERICKKFRIIIIEDAAEALNTYCNGKHAGTIGEHGVLSFNGNKIVTTSGGGALLTHSSAIREKALYWATQSKLPGDSYHHAEVGYNYRLSNISAAIGLGQLEQFDLISKRKAGIEQFYLKELGELDWLKVVKAPNGSNHWLTVALIRHDFLSKISPSQLINLANVENIEMRRFWKPLHMQPLFEKSEKIGGEVCEDLYARGFCLPSGVGLTEKQLERIVGFVKAI